MNKKTMAELVRTHRAEAEELKALLTKHDDALEPGTYNCFEFEEYGSPEYEALETELRRMYELAEIFNLDPSTYHPWESCVFDAYGEEEEEEEDDNYMLFFIDDTDAEKLFFDEVGYPEHGQKAA